MDPITMILAGLGGQIANQTIVPWLGNKINGLFGINQQQEQQDPNEALQDYYRQQIQQQPNNGMEQRQQQLMNQFNQQIIPGIQEQFAGAGGLRSSGFDRQLAGALTNLGTNLGALGEENAFQNSQLNQNRLGQISNYLSGQQQLGLQGQQLAQQGNIANREHQLRGLGLMQQYDIGQQEQGNRRADISSRLQEAYARMHAQPRFNTGHYGAQPAGLGPFVGQVIGGAAGAATGRPFGV